MPSPTSADEAMRLLTSRRCLRPETLRAFGIVPNPALAAWEYPVQGGRRYKAWDPQSSGRKYWHTRGVRNQLYGLDRIPEGTEEVWLVNGEPSVWACHQAGLHAVCGIFGEGRLPDGAAVELMRRGVRHVRICFDLDPAGEAGALRAAAALRPPLTVTVHRLPAALGEHADIGDLYSALGGDDQVFLATVQALPGEPYEPELRPVFPTRQGRRPGHPAADRWWRTQEALVLAVSRYQAVRREGPRWVTLCPWHGDRNPSMVLYPDGRAYCFGCGWSGDAIDWIRQKEHLPTNQEAIRALSSMLAHGQRAMHEKVR